MYPCRRLWGLAVLLLVGAVSADNSDCPCVLPEVCATKPIVEEASPCEDPKTIRCCEATSLHDSHSSEHLHMVREELTQEQQFMEAIDDLMKKIEIVAAPVGERQDKSLDGTSKNALGCDGKQCEKNLEIKNEELVDQPSLNNVKDLSEISSVESLQPNITEEDHKEKEAGEKLVIVYAQSPNNNTHGDNSPYIVYPSEESMEEYLENEETSVVEQKVSQEENKQENESEEKKETAAKQESTDRKSNLQKLFPKRNPPLKSSQTQTDPDDLGEAGSEIEEVKYSVPSNTQTEQPLIRKPFRPLLRQQSHRPATTDESVQTSDVFEPQIGSGGKMGLLTPTVDLSKNIQYQDQTAAIMDEINLKAINSMMKTNFTPRTSFPRRQRPSWHPLQSHPHVTTGTATDIPSGRTPQDLNNLPQSSPHFGGSSNLPDQTQIRPLENIHSVEHATDTTATEVRGNRYVPRRRNQFTKPNVNLPPKISTTVSMSQEQAFDTLKETKPQDPSRRRQSYRRLQVKTQSGTPIADLTEQINAQSDPSFGRRRNKFRPRSKTVNTAPTKPNNEFSDSRNFQNPESIVVNPNQPGVNRNAMQHGHAAPFTSSERPQESDVQLEGDLDGSGSEIQPQRVRVRGRFFPPQQMETGFQPMVEHPELHVVGLVPAGFHDRARGDEDLGLQLPRSNLNSQFSEADQEQYDYEEETEKPSRLLPPVFPVSQPPVTIGKSSAAVSTSPKSYSDADLLPPLEKPKPLSETLAKVMHVKAAEMLMLDEHRDITQLNQEFNDLKNRYDMLLNRYAETLKTYNERYRNLIGSTDDTK